MATAGKYKFTSKKYKRLMDFSGGLNNKFSPFLIKDNEVSDIQNMNFDEKGTLRTRRGFKRHYAAPFATGPIRGLFNFRKSDGTSKLIMAADDKLFYDNPHFVKLYDTQADYDAETKSNVDTSSSAGDIKIATPATPTFTRNSVAYNDDGTQVAANVPRFRAGKFGQGILFEGITTNLLTPNQSSAEVDATGLILNTPGGAATKTRDSVDKFVGSASQKVVVTSACSYLEVYSATMAVSANTAYTFSGFVKADRAGCYSYARIAWYNSFGTWISSSDSAGTFLNLGYQRIGVSALAPANAAFAGVDMVTAPSPATSIPIGATFNYSGFQLEQKSFPSTWILGGTTRSADSMVLPSSLIANKSDFTIEFYFNLTVQNNGLAKILWIMFIDVSNYWVIGIDDAGVVYFSIVANGLVTTTSGQLEINTFKHIAAVRSGDQIRLLINGVLQQSKTSLDPTGSYPLSMYFGGDAWNEACWGTMDDLRVSSRARTDAEIIAAYQSNQPLPWDVDTTYKLNFEGNLNFPSDRGGRWTTRSIDITQVTDKSSGVITKQITQPTNSTVKIKTRTSADQNTWSTWAEIGANGFIQSPSNNYLQVQLEMTTTDFATVVPKLSQMQITFDSTPQAKQLIAGLSSVARVQCATQNDIVFAVNGENPNKKWDGITASALDQGGSPPVCKYILVHKNRMFLAGNPTNPSRIYFSTIGSPEDWPVLNFIDVGRGDGDVITGLSVVLDNVIIYKENSRWVLQGDAPSNFVLRKSGDDGASSPSTIIVKDSLACLAKDGVRFFDGLRSVVGSEKIEGTINNLNKRYLDKSSLAYFENKLMVAVPEGNVNYNNLILVFDSLRTAWTLYRGISASEFCIWKHYDEDVLLFGSATTGQVYEFDEDSFSDDGAAIDAWAVPAHMPLDGIEVMKLIKGIIIGGSSQNGSVDAVLNVSFIKDQGAETASQPLTLTKGGKLTMGKLIPAVVGVSLARTLAIKLRHTSATTGADIYSITTEYTPKGVRV